MMESGTHDYVAAQLAAERRDNIPTLAEVKAAMPMVTRPDGALAPAKLPEFGWAGDGDRDSAQAAQLAILVRGMDAMVDAWLSDPDQGIDEAEEICRTWRSIREITQSNQTAGE